MTVRSRFIKSVIATAEADTTKLPWNRGSARRRMIMGRSAPVTLKLRTTRA